jgi:DNA-binding PadR family transcriptional regulator
MEAGGLCCRFEVGVRAFLFASSFSLILNLLRDFYITVARALHYSESEFTLNYFWDCLQIAQKLVKYLEREVVNKVYERFLKEFMDILIMVKMREGEVSGYDILTYFHGKFDLLVSPGTVYSVLYSMERKGLIKAQGVEKKRIYTLTTKGEATIKAIQESSEVLESFLARLLEKKESIPTQVM